MRRDPRGWMVGEGSYLRPNASNNIAPPARLRKPARARLRKPGPALTGSGRAAPRARTRPMDPASGPTIRCSRRIRPIRIRPAAQRSGAADERAARRSKRSGPGPPAGRLRRRALQTSVRADGWSAGRFGAGAPRIRPGRLPASPSTGTAMSPPSAHRVGASGTSSQKVAPPVALLVTPTCPPCASAIARTMASPRPDAPVSRLRAASAW